VCLRAHDGNEDGHNYIKEAAAAGAAAVIVERTPEVMPNDIAVIELIDIGTRKALGLIAANFYGNPSRDMKVIGVTGTKGKTSVTYFFNHILSRHGDKSGYIGTTGAFACDEKIDIPYATASTPDTIQLQEIFGIMRERGVEFCSMEVTSIALALDRVHGTEIHTGLFTNFSQDHLDFHITMEEYLKAKTKLFTFCKNGIVNADDPAAAQVLKTAACPTVTFGIKADADYKAENVRLMNNHSTFDINIKGTKQTITVPIPGLFSVYNVLACVATCAELGVPAETIASAVAELPPVPGRFEVVENDRGITVIVDYAHSPSSLEGIIESVRGFTEGRVITLFGCGGDKDKGKRPIMGEIGGNLSDYCIITSDNPRNEEPETIINQILVGLKMTKCEYVSIIERAAAIEHALNIAETGDSVIIAGKGHEDYMEFENKRRVPYNDIEEARKHL
jgi:UDP-N-acetylmuramoyl-L-alanyl-D-glutamate--2,6-diaminopimelate ligase